MKMKKSECFRQAQIAVVNSTTLAPTDKLEILKALMEEERIQAVCEEVQAKKESEVAPY